MGRQLNYYMEVDVFKQLVQKAFDLGFIFIEESSIKSKDSRYYGEFKKYQSIDNIDFSIQEVKYYFYLEDAGEIIVKDNGFIDIHQSPVIEVGYSRIDENAIPSSRIWVSSGYYENETFINRPDILDEKYSSLARFVKKLAPYTDTIIKYPNNKTYRSKEYITPYLLNLMVQSISVRSG